MSDKLEQLWNSTASLRERFGLEDNLDSQLRKLFEEVYELLAELIKPYTFKLDSFSELKESTDVMVTMMSVLMAKGWSYDSLADAIDEVIAKNDAKTHETHEVVNGMITRKHKGV